jgi:hypothetical protein
MYTSPVFVKKKMWENPGPNPPSVLEKIRKLFYEWKYYEAVARSKLAATVLCWEKIRQLFTPTGGRGHGIGRFFARQLFLTNQHRSLI